MFFVKGWSPLSEVAKTTRLRYWRERLFGDESLPYGPEFGKRMEELNRVIIPEVWAICESAPRVGILLTNGRVIDAVPELVSSAAEDDASNVYLNLFVGTLGSSYWYRDPETERLTDRPIGYLEYEPFVGLPVLLPEVCLTRAREGLEKTLPQDGPSAPSAAPAALARSIVDLHDRGAAMTKATYRELLAPGVSFRAFEAAWRMAAEQRPALAKPGRRPSEIDTA